MMAEFIDITEQVREARLRLERAVANLDDQERVELVHMLLADMPRAKRVETVCLLYLENVADGAAELNDVRILLRKQKKARRT
jgi:hypothetical protein